MSKVQVKWTPQVELDLDFLREHIARNFNVDLAIKISEEIITKIEELIINNPLCGQVVESNPLFSKINYKKNTVFYCENPKDKMIYIVHLQARKTDLNKDRIQIDFQNS